MTSLVLFALLSSSAAMGQDSSSTLNAPLTNERVSAMINAMQPAKGDTGPAGKDGAPGPKGDQGLPGKDGVNGSDGLPGKDGANGKDGAPGVKGDQGLPGKDGATGLTGANGKDGAIGLPGVNGTNGKDGAPGAKGDKGDKGDTGATGATGAAGGSGATFLPNATFGQTATVAINAGYRKVTTTVNGCIIGERVLLTPTAALPDGYSLADAYCLTANTLTINVYAPLLAIGVNYSITTKVTVFR